MYLFVQFHPHMHLRDERLDSIRAREPNEIFINVPPNDDKNESLKKL